MNIILIILVFGVIVFFHEFGHFIVAKMNKIAVMEFSIGMGPAIVSVQKKETKYSLRLLPIGGYCMMMGEDEESEDENAFNNKPLLARILVIAAGPVFNFILAFFFAIVLIHFTGCDPATVTTVVDGSAAWESGVEAGDTIKEINGDKIYNYREVLLFMQVENPSEPVNLLLERADGSQETVIVTPKQNEQGEYKLGIGGGYFASSGIANDIRYAAYELRYWMKSTVLGLRMIVTGGVKNGDIMGPVGVGSAMNDVIEEAKDVSTTRKEAVINVLLNLLNWSILLSVNLGIMNLLPIPALDGGRLLFLFIEAIRRKRIPQEKEAIVNLIGVCLLMLLMVVVFFNDIKNAFF